MGIFFGGQPVEADVKKLLVAFPDIQPDQTITYEAVETVLGIKRDPEVTPGKIDRTRVPPSQFAAAKHEASRFRTITNSWRARLLREQNIVMVTVLNTGFRRLLEGERTTKAVKNARAGVRAIGKSAKAIRLVAVEKLNPEELHCHDHTSRLIYALADANSRTAKELAVPEVKSLPRATPKE